MSVKLFVGGLSFTTSNDSLRAAFARFGIVASAQVMMDRATGRSRGFGFVEMATGEEAERAIGGLNGTLLDGRAIRVDKATPRGAPGSGPARRPGPGGPPPSRGGPGGGGGGGFPPRGGGGGADRPWGNTRGSGRGGQRRGDWRPAGGEGEPKRSGNLRRKPGGERRSGDKGRRGEDSGYRW